MFRQRRAEICPGSNPPVRRAFVQVAIMRLNRVFSLFSGVVLLLSAFSVADNASAQQQQQQQEKRIALVIGNGAYAKAPLSTAANDGGLIAQTLQAAGFDVTGARDLDGDALRGAFRDFMKKAEDSGPDTVAMVYLAGYGIQYAGENYYIPVDSKIARDTDIPTEGLRIGDYMRQLVALPLKVSIVVLDIAREQPFIAGGSIASGLAMVEPNPHMLVAFNAAPGTVAPEEQGAYGVYAQALAEMIRTGGLSLPDLFNRVRLRVNENTKGAQVPWDTQRVDSQFMFFDRAPDAPPLGIQDQAARDKPIRDLGASEAYAAALDRDTLQGYEDFLAAYPTDPMAKRVRAIIAARREAITWRRTYSVNTPDAYWSYLRRYPRGPHAADARRRLAILAAALEPPATFAMIDYDVPPPPPDEIVYVDRPVLMFSDPEFDFAPPPPPPVFFLPPPPPDFVVLEPPPPPIGLFFLPRPFFVPIPAYVQPPVYVRPPPNDIIFANIHNTTVIKDVINRPPPAGSFNPARPLVNPPPGGAPGAGPSGGQPKFHLAGAPLPAAVARRASLIQQGKAPVPPSASINTVPPGGFAARPGVRPQGPRMSQQPGAAQPGATAPAKSAPPTGAPIPPKQVPAGPREAAPHALPVPGTKGGPPEPRAHQLGVTGSHAPGSGAVSPHAVPRHAPPSAAARTHRPGRAVVPPRPPGPPARPAAPRRPQPGIRPESRRPIAPPHVARPAASAPHAPPRIAPPPHPAPRRVPPPPRAAPPPRVAPPRIAAPARPRNFAPRPAARPAPPRSAGPAKRCPPNVPRC
jgi:uncharacterized caspase-like protein